ncbi:unnamed protein product [Cyclocybe aegerita]|uniref:CFEM domain-containing protein n=1 Tax=Cyclocybe aegerita TaxID=1973307 RepID=A0A8S0W0T5_CYCAE|nr:unnamed protein product [Cyclocybe aegerita]
MAIIRSFRAVSYLYHQFTEPFLNTVLPARHIGLRGRPLLNRSRGIESINSTTQPIFLSRHSSMRFSIVALVIGAAATASSAAAVDAVVESRGDYNWPKCAARCWPPNPFKYQCAPFDYGCLCRKHDKWSYDLKYCFKKYCNDYDYKQSGKGVGYYCKNYGYTGWN